MTARSAFLESSIVRDDDGRFGEKPQTQPEVALTDAEGTTPVNHYVEAFESTDPTRLAQLAAHPDPDLQYSAIANEAFHPHGLRILLENSSGPDDVRAYAAAGNSSTPKDALLAYSHKYGADHIVARQLISNTSLDWDEVLVLGKAHSKEHREIGAIVRDAMYRRALIATERDNLTPSVAALGLIENEDSKSEAGKAALRELDRRARLAS